MADLYRKFEKEKKALVPKRDYLDGHPLEDKIRKVCFKSALKNPNVDETGRFSEDLQTPIRTIVSKTYTDMFKAVRYSCNRVLTEDAEVEQHLDYIFEELAKYQEEAKALILKHYRELKSTQS